MVTIQFIQKPFRFSVEGSIVEQNQRNKSSRQLSPQIVSTNLAQTTMGPKTATRFNGVQPKELNQFTTEHFDSYNAAPCGYHSLDQNGTFVRINDTELEWLGYSRDEVIGRMKIADMLTAASVSLYEETFPLLKEQGEVRDLEMEMLRKDGTTIPVLVNATAIKDVADNYCLSRATVIDITERKQAEALLQKYRGDLEEQVRKHTVKLDSANVTLKTESKERKQAEQALWESQEQMAGIIESAMDAIITVDEAQRIVLFNSAAEKMFATSAAESLGQSLDRFLPERIRQQHQQDIADFAQTRVTKRTMGSLGALYGLRADGEEFPVEASISQLEVSGRRFFTVILRDISERIQREAQLREQSELLDFAREAILVRDMNGHIRFWNKGAERLYGWTAEEALGRDICELNLQDTSQQFDQANRKVIKQGEWRGELNQQTKDGRKIITEGYWTLVRDPKGQPRSILTINSDITEKKKLETQYLRAQRMESIGTLASGIAHDLNNILSPILMAVQLLQSWVTNESGQRILSLLGSNAERGGEMVKQILSFARGVEGEHVLLQPVYVIKEIIKILRETLPKDIEISFSLPTNIWAITGDATQIHQVLMNLCVNARDAMPNGGQLRIEAENVTIDEQYARMNLDAKPGSYVRITVADTGSGIPPKIIDRIFDPFFTTKEQSKGTGLGLSTVIGIVKSHVGFVNVYSEIGSGTKFRVYLPSSETGQATSAEEERQELPFGKGEIILVADDENAIRQITKETLEAFNYRVLTAGDGTEAVALYAQHMNDIAGVITDMMMPFLDGPATIRALQKLNPQVKVIATSGLKANAKVNEAANAGVRIFLTKPYTAEKLLKALAEILHDDSAIQQAD